MCVEHFHFQAPSAFSRELLMGRFIEALDNRCSLYCVNTDV